jgi:hypothetical protein
MTIHNCILPCNTNYIVLCDVYFKLSKVQLNVFWGKIRRLLSSFVCKNSECKSSTQSYAEDLSTDLIRGFCCLWSSSANLPFYINQNESLSLRIAKLYLPLTCLTSDHKLKFLDPPSRHHLTFYSLYFPITFIRKITGRKVRIF